MKRWTVFLVVALAIVAFAAAAHAGMFCDQAAGFDYKSPTLNWHCMIEWLWEITT